MLQLGIVINTFHMILREKNKNKKPFFFYHSLTMKIVNIFSCMLVPGSMDCNCTCTHDPIFFFSF